MPPRHFRPWLSPFSLDLLLLACLDYVRAEDMVVVLPLIHSKAVPRRPDYGDTTRGWNWGAQGLPSHGCRAVRHSFLSTPLCPVPLVLLVAGLAGPRYTTYSA
jgi:hypothetical protein